VSTALVVSQRCSSNALRTHCHLEANDFVTKGLVKVQQDPETFNIEQLIKQVAGYAHSWDKWGLYAPGSSVRVWLVSF
jgi:hypothetical protein